MIDPCDCLHCPACGGDSFGNRETPWFTEDECETHECGARLRVVLGGGNMPYACEVSADDPVWLMNGDDAQRPGMDKTLPKRPETDVITEADIRVWEQAFVASAGKPGSFCIEQPVQLAANILAVNKGHSRCVYGPDMLGRLLLHVHTERVVVRHAYRDGVHGAVAVIVGPVRRSFAGLTQAEAIGREMEDHIMSAAGSVLRVERL
jgi:hypothetical protein